MGYLGISYLLGYYLYSLILVFKLTICLYFGGGAFVFFFLDPLSHLFLILGQAIV